MSPAPNTTTTRLRLKAAGPVTGTVDGAWWPRSDDLSAELPPLLADLEPGAGPVARVAYRLDDWGPAPRRLPHGQVRLEGFRSTVPHTVTLTGPTGLRLVLLVVPATTSGATAESVMSAAADPAERHSPTELLAGAELPR
ncbi:DUF5994 family protein [Actinomycetospora corticicola]|uniref:Uncharacterized protein n=1 Tax=Actinomycetospora corticicola TaxID=663602 RepID=A0A7Y9DT61_9PSEU|nr:hypothetical protein [Actinomycetospora corticicola]